MYVLCSMYTSIESYGVLRFTVPEATDNTINRRSRVQKWRTLDYFPHESEGDRDKYLQISVDESNGCRVHQWQHSISLVGP